ncbi:hypothetical protein ACGFYE_39575 [Streptomyces zaomyceticus]|uniref:RapZ C-terminal domain-containing protein n=1 Tax=Streptomyces zaomyceticus TaxID=68286 RepID=UPI00371781F2
MPAIRLTSFGYPRLPAGQEGQPIPPTNRIDDVRDQLCVPAVDRDILDLDVLKSRVQDVVLNTYGARDLLANLADYADLPSCLRRSAIGCVGGKHKAAVLTELRA